MGEKSNIEWTGDTLNVFVAIRPTLEGMVTGWHCVKVSAGCANCYAARQNEAMHRGGTGLPYVEKSLEEIEMHFAEDRLEKQLKKQRPRMIFVNSMTDTFGEFVPDDWIIALLETIAVRGVNHVWQILTKRADRMKEVVTKWLEQSGRLSVPSCIWLGVTVENDKVMHARLRALLSIPAAVRWVSAEPLLEAIDLRAIEPGDDDDMPQVTYDALTGNLTGQEGPFEIGEMMSDCCGAAIGDESYNYSPACVSCGRACRPIERAPRIHWVVVGGESGNGARDFNVSWAAMIVAQCEAAGVGVFVKQLGRSPVSRVSELWPDQVTRYRIAEDPLDLRRVVIDSKGNDIDLWPDRIRRREWPCNWNGWEGQIS